MTPALLDGIVSLTAYHGRASVRQLTAAYGPHWLRPLRTAAVWVMRREAGASYRAIGSRFAGMHPSNIGHRVAAAERLRSSDPAFGALPDRVVADLRAEAA